MPLLSFISCLRGFKRWNGGYYTKAAAALQSIFHIVKSEEESRTLCPLEGASAACAVKGRKRACGSPKPAFDRDEFKGGNRG
jgi:hypothetical protein